MYFKIVISYRQWGTILMIIVGDDVTTMTIYV